MEEIRRNWKKETQPQMLDSERPEHPDFYVVHRVLADFPEAYAALREAFRVRDAAVGPAVLCSRCQCKVE
jgi:hypothetical protein